MASSIYSRAKQFFKEVWISMMTTKKIPYVEECRLERTLTKMDIFLWCIGVVTTSFYQEIPNIINAFGYMIFFPVLLAGMMSYITSLCYAELISINATSGGCYRYVYYAIGEIMAFLIGWCVIFISSIRLIHCMENLVKTIDGAFFNYCITDLTKEHLSLGKGIENYFLRIYSNAHIETIFASLAIIASCSLALKYSKIFVNVAALSNLIIIIICLSIFWFCMDLSKFNVISKTKDYYFFTRGLVLGHLFYIDLEVALYAGNEAINPNVTIPKGLIMGFKWGFIIYIASIILYTKRERKPLKDEIKPMQISLSKLGFEPFHVMPSIGQCLCYFMSGAARIFILSRVTHSMASDGMLFPFFTKVHPLRKNPLIGILILGSICATVTIFIGDAPSSELAMIAMVDTLRIFMLITFLVMRYRCEIFTDEFDSIGRWVLLNYPHPILSPNKSTHSFSMKLIFLSVISIIFSLLLLVVYIISYNHKHTSLKILFIISAVIALISIHLLNLQPQNDSRNLSSRLQGVPFTPFMAITWYILILILLPNATWIKFCCWWLIGNVF